MYSVWPLMELLWLIALIFLQKNLLMSKLFAARILIRSEFCDEFLYARAAPWWVTVNMPTGQTDRQADRRTEPDRYITLSATRFQSTNLDCSRCIKIITGPPSGPVLFCWLASVVVCRMLSSVTLPAGGPALAGRVDGRATDIAWRANRVTSR